MLSTRPKFGSTYGLDLGASNRVQGNLRVRTFNDQGQSVGHVTQGLASPDGFENGENLLQGLATRIQKAKQENQAELPQTDQINSIVAFVPGQANLQSHVSILANLITHAGESLKNIDFAKLPHLLKKNDSSVNPDCRVVVVNDMVGGIAEATSQLAQKYPSHFKPGLELCYMATGGGFGIANADYEADGKIRIKANETGHYFDNEMGQVLEKGGASVSALINNFVNALPIEENQRQLLRDQKRGEIVTHYDKFKEQIPTITKATFHEAADSAVNQYLAALAIPASFKLLEGTNLIVLAGPVVNAVKNYIQNNQERFASDIAAHEQAFSQNQSRPAFEKVLLNRIFNRLDNTGKAQFAQKHFDLITDIHVPDNTLGASYIAKGQFNGRSDRYIIPANVFKPKTL